MIGQLGRIPTSAERPVIEYEGLVFNVEKVAKKRITLIKICRTEKHEPEEDKEQ